MPNTNINNGFIQRVIPLERRSHEWEYRAYSNHLASNQYFDLLTHSAAVYWLWVIDEIYRGRSNRNRTLA
jgi:hypothetical protein